jgi:hypothetical protein
MKRVVVICALVLGGVAAVVVPSDWVLLVVLPPFVACIVLGWYVAFKSNAVQLRPFRLFFWPSVDITAPVKQSRALLALGAAAAFVAGSCLGLLLQVQNA